MIKSNLLLVLVLGLTVACSHNNIVQKKPVVAKAKPVIHKISGKYIDHHNGIITDTSTGLMWKKCSEGQSGRHCNGGKAKNYLWNDAANRFKQVSFAGYSDWRVPTLPELTSLVYCSTGVPIKIALDYFCDGKKLQYKDNPYQRPTINLKAFPNTPEWKFWSSTDNYDASSRSRGYPKMAIYFYNGADIVNKTASHIRLVRKK